MVVLSITVWGMVVNIGAQTQLKMRTIESKYPRLVNCLGNIDLVKYNPKCHGCKWIYECNTIRKMLKQKDFLPGKYRSDIP
jgi:hypothetical protein